MSRRCLGSVLSFRATCDGNSGKLTGILRRVPNRSLHLRSVGPGTLIRTHPQLTPHSKLERGIRLHIPALLSGGRLSTDSPPPPITPCDATGDRHSTLGGGRVGFDVSCHARNFGRRFDFERYLRQRPYGRRLGWTPCSEFSYSHSNCHIDLAAATYRGALLCNAQVVRSTGGLLTNCLIW